MKSSTERIRLNSQPEFILVHFGSFRGWSVFKLILIELDVKKRIQIELPPDGPVQVTNSWATFGDPKLCKQLRFSWAAASN